MKGKWRVEESSESPVRYDKSTPSSGDTPLGP
jgi:hypothetical protein